MTGQRSDEPPAAESRLLGALYEISTSTGHSLDPGELVKLVAERAGELLHADAVALYLWDDTVGALVPVFSNDARLPGQEKPLRPGEGAAGQAIQLRKTIIVDDYETWEHAVSWGLERELKSVEAVPLMVRDRPIGALIVRFYSPRRAGEEEERTLTLLAAQVSPALEAARLYAASRVEREHERALREIAQALAANLDERRVLDLAVHYSAELLHAPFARVWLIQPNGQLSCAAAEGYVHAETFSRRLPANSTSGYVAHQQIVNLANAPSEPSWTVNREFGERTGLGAYLGAGLWRAGESLGVIEVMRETGYSFTAVEELILVALANAVAVAVSNARTHAAMRRLAREADLRAEGLRQRDTILQAVAFAAEKLLTTAEWEPSIDEVLSRLGAATDASRVYIVAAAPNAQSGVATRYEWAAPGVSRSSLWPSGSSDLASVGLGRWEQILREGGTITGPLRRFPEDEREILAQQGVCSLIVVPIFVGAQWWGYIGFDDCRDQRDWPPSAVEVLRTAAGTLGAAILRRRAEAERLELVREQSARAEAEAAQRRVAFLAEASQILAASLDYETTLQGVADLVVPAMADCCLIHLRDGTIREVARTAVPAFARSLPTDAWAAVDAEAEHPLADVVRSGQPALWASVPWLDAEACGSAWLSGLIVPLVARAGVTGAMTWLRCDTRAAYQANDLSLAQDLARRCALAVDNSRLYRAARAAISLRDEFLSVAAHELKTPMTSLRGYAQLLEREFDRDRAGATERARRAATTILVQSDKLARLVSQLLDISRIQSGRLAVERKQTDLAALIREVIDATRTQLKRHTLVARLPDELWLTIDPLRMEQVMTNLIDNAIKYSPEGGTIDVTLTAEDSTAQIAVRDRGVGVPIEHRAHIFERFYQAQVGGPLTSMAGMGLGLYISRQIVELHDGTIEAEYPEDGGTRFVVTLPRV